MEIPARGLTHKPIIDILVGKDIANYKDLVEYFQKEFKV
jgi:hypothetical protein